MSDLGIYVHIPFCLRKCRYCDFCSFVGQADKMHAYTSSLLSELRGRAEEYHLRGKRVDTIFFGGGTPSLMPIECMTAILREIRALFSVSEDAEITLEANPATADLETLCALP